MKQGSTVFLRITVLGLGCVVGVICAVLLPAIYRGWPLDYPEIGYLQYPAMLGIIITASFFFIALYQTMKLLDYIDRNNAFSELSIKALRIIKYCAVGIGVVYAVGMPLIYYMGDKEDAPGLIVLGLIFTFAPIVIAVFAAVCQRLLHDALIIKAENELTV